MAQGRGGRSSGFGGNRPRRNGHPSGPSNQGSSFWRTVPGQNKRKRDDDSSRRGPPARRQRVESASMEYDISSIRRSMPLPDFAQFSSMPKDVFSNPKNHLSNSFKASQTQSSCRFITLSTSHYQCIVSCRIPGYEATEAIGEGKNKRQAEHAAYTHLLSKLLSNGFLDELWPRTEKIDQKTLREEKDAVIDVYDYAARYNCIPRFTEEVQRSKFLRGKITFEVTIQMPEHNIQVSGKAVSRTTAGVAAALKFKKEAEKYHLSRGMDSLIIKDASSLSVNNARQFFEFYKDIDRNAQVNIQVNGDQGDFTAQAQLNGESLGEEVRVTGKKAKAEDLAYLVAALSLTKQEPDLLRRFLKALRAGNGQILRMAPPIDLEISSDSMRNMEDTLRDASRAGLRDEVEDLEEEDKSNERERRPRAFLSPEQASERSEHLSKVYKSYLSRSDLEELRETKARLPMSQYADKVIDLVDKNTYSIVIGATGSGKTTQVPQIIVDHAIREGRGAFVDVICTQPRRIAATSVAKRVAQERAQRLQETVGHHVRFDAKLPKPGGSITYCTTGILLQQLQHNPDDVLGKVSHLVIDEVHERDMLIDFLLITLKKTMNERRLAGQKVPKVILMSATIDSELFASYFRNTDGADGVDEDCPTLSVPGRTFPVKEKYLETILKELDENYGSSKLRLMYSNKPTVQYFEHEKEFAQQNPIVDGRDGKDPQDKEEESIIDWKKKAIVSSDGEVTTSTELEDSLVPVGIVATTIAHISNTSDHGSILVFLPGLDEILAVEKLLREDRPLGVNVQDETKFKLYMLHSSIQDSQSTVFDPVPDGCRKIILATNIAETSITIPDVQYVVDTGKLREKRYDQLRRITKLQCTWISKSNSKQRAGRAGRVQNGHYYALFSRSRFASLRAIGLPELLRSDLQETCLDVKAQAFKTPIGKFLDDAIEPPSPAAVETAVDNLVKLDALTDEEELTALGRLLATLPVHPSLGKMIVLGMIFRCLDPLIVLGAAAGDRSLFTNPLEARAAAKKAKTSFEHGSDSDHIATLNAFNELRYRRDAQGYHAMREYAFSKFLHLGAFNSISNTAGQIQDILVNAGLIPREDPSEHGHGGVLLNENSNKIEMVKALTLAGLHPNLGLTTNDLLFRTPGEKSCMIHPSSVLGDQFGRPKDNKRAKPRTEPKLLTYTMMAKSNDGHSTFLRDATLVHPLMAALFGGRLYSSERNGHSLEMDGWLQFYIQNRGFRAARTILEFKGAMDRMQIEAFRDLSKKQSLAENNVREIFARSLQEILVLENKSELRRALSPPPPRQTKKFYREDFSPAMYDTGIREVAHI